MSRQRSFGAPLGLTAPRPLRTSASAESQTHAPMRYMGRPASFCRMLSSPQAVANFFPSRADARIYILQPHGAP